VPSILKKMKKSPKFSLHHWFQHLAIFKDLIFKNIPWKSVKKITSFIFIWPPFWQNDNSNFCLHNWFQQVAIFKMFSLKICNVMISFHVYPFWHQGGIRNNVYSKFGIHGRRYAIVLDFVEECKVVGNPTWDLVFFDTINLGFLA